MRQTALSALMIVMLTLLVAACDTADPDDAAVPTLADPPTVAAADDAAPTVAATAPETSDTTDDSASSDPAPANDSDAEFTGSLSGAMESTLNGFGYIKCQTTPDGTNLLLVQDESGDFAFFFRADGQPGTYDMVTSLNAASNAAELYLAGQSITDVEGSVQLEAIPTAQDEAMTGAYEFSATNDAGEQITGSGAFDLTFSLAEVMACPFIES